MNNQSPSSLLAMLQQQLQAARSLDDTINTNNRAGTIMQVPRTGKILSSAYEQLRNAAEYAEEHLLLQHAIRRFFNRTMFMAGGRPKSIGSELIVELTQAGYLLNNTFSQEAAHTISTMASRYEQIYKQLRQAHTPKDKALDWSLSILAVETENLLSPHHRLSVMAYTAYQHYSIVLERPRDASDEYDMVLLIAIHQALLKSDIAIVRTELQRAYGSSPENLHEWIKFNKTIDRLYVGDQTQQLKRLIIKRGAPFRILNNMAHDRPDLPELLSDKSAFMAAYRQQIKRDYTQAQNRIGKGVIKSIVFILITKVIIGLGIEVPFDILIYGHVILLPLIINLLVPPLYMASLRLSLRMPAKNNAQQLSRYIETTLFGDGDVQQFLRRDTGQISSTARVIYSILFLVPFMLTILLLMRLQFNPLQMIIFFVFLSTASFLGFRLNTMVRELELTGHQGGLLTSLRDFFYLPFILFGQWLSSRYAKINAVAYLLDIAIEMPLKTVLRLVRQWIRFLNEKRDEIY